MTNKSTYTKISLFVSFVTVSAIFSVNGNVYAQQNVTLSEALNVTDTAEQNFTNENEQLYQLKKNYCQQRQPMD